MATYLFLESERNASDGSLLDSLHQVSREAGNLVSKSLCLNLADVVDDSLVHMEVVGQPKTNRRAQLARCITQTHTKETAVCHTPRHLLSVVLLNKCSGGPLNGLGSYSSLHTESGKVSEGARVFPLGSAYLPLFSLLNTRFY